MASTSSRIIKSPFRTGLKAVHLPEFTITLLRTPHHPPTLASFLVPLNLNKLDLRDYLYHAYSIRTLNIRSYVHQYRVRQGKPDSARPTPRKWFRPRSSKKMIIEMDKPFVWPKEYSDEELEEWHKSTYHRAAKDQGEFQKLRGPEGDRLPDKEQRSSLREQARALLAGKERWRPSGKTLGL